MATNTRRRSERRRAARAATRAAIERQYGMPLGALKPKPLTHHGYAPALRPTKPAIGSGKNWKKNRRFQRKNRYG